MRAVASNAKTLEAPLRATCSKSQPPHLVFGWFYYCLLNLTFDRLLSGVKRRLSARAFRVNNSLVPVLNEQREQQSLTRRSRASEAFR
jgi:hypothetical protein